MTDVHFFTAEGAMCGSPDAARLTLVSASVTCSTCAEALAAREVEEHRRPARAPRVLARIRATGWR